MAIRILTDSTSYIPKDILDEYNIKVISLSVLFGDEAYKETDITNKFFYKKLESFGQIPTSSQPSMDELYKLFENEVKIGNSVVGLFISSEMSGTFSTATMIKNNILEEYPDAKIELIDSKSNCMQLGFAVMEAAKAAHEGKLLNEVCNIAKDNLQKSRFLFIPETLEYLRKGGRIGTAKALLGGLLKIIPILTVTDGSTNVLEKVRTKKKSVSHMVELFKADIDAYGFGDVIVHHIDCEEEATELSKALETIVNKPVKVTPIGPVIGTHVGPGAIGLVYYTKEKLS